jgi:hypothetical protein
VLSSCWHPMVYTTHKQADLMQFLLTSRTRAGMRERFSASGIRSALQGRNHITPEGQPPAAGLNPRDDYRSLTGPLADR